MPADLTNLIAPLIDLTAASFGAMVGSLIGFPLDTIKTKMQIYHHLYRNSFDCAYQVVKKDGVRGLYLGVLPGMWGDVVEKSVLFCSYNICQKIICDIRQRKRTSVLDDAIAGFFGASVASVAMNPIEVVKVRLQALSESGHKTKLVSNMNMVRNVFLEEGFIDPYVVYLTWFALAHEGIRGFYVGLTSTMAREMPGYFFYFGGYGLALKYLKLSENDEKKQAILKTLTAGAIASLSFWLIIFPFDTVKAKIQVEFHDEKMLSVFRRVLHKEGITSLYKGLGPTLVRMIPTTGALFVAYENSRSFMIDKFLPEEKKRSKRSLQEMGKVENRPKKL